MMKKERKKEKAVKQNVKVQKKKTKTCLKIQKKKKKKECNEYNSSVANGTAQRKKVKLNVKICFL